MSHNKTLTRTTIGDILFPYGIKNIDSYQLLSGGSENTNYLIKTPIQDYVLTIVENKSFEKSKELAAFLDYLDANNFASSKIVLTKDGQAITSWHNKPIMIKEFLHGAISHDLSANLLTDLGAELAKLHTLSAPDYLPQTVSYGIERFDEVKVYAAESCFYAWLKETEVYIEKSMSFNLPKSMIHSDIFCDNIIISKDGKTATIMDFEEVSYYYRIFDIGMMIIGTCRSDGALSLEKAKDLLKGYQQNIKLQSSEVKALQAFTTYGAAAIAFWRHQNFNYVNVDTTMKDHYLTMKNLADDVMGIPHAQFQQQLGINILG